MRAIAKKMRYTDPSQAWTGVDVEVVRQPPHGLWATTHTLGFMRLICAFRLNLGMGNMDFEDFVDDIIEDHNVYERPGVVWKNSIDDHQPPDTVGSS